MSGKPIYLTTVNCVLYVIKIPTNFQLIFFFSNVSELECNPVEF